MSVEDVRLGISRGDESLHLVSGFELAGAARKASVHDLVRGMGRLVAIGTGAQTELAGLREMAMNICARVSDADHAYDGAVSGTQALEIIDIKASTMAVVEGCGEVCVAAVQMDEKLTVALAHMAEAVALLTDYEGLRRSASVAAESATVALSMALDASAAYDARLAGQ